MGGKVPKVRVEQISADLKDIDFTLGGGVFPGGRLPGGGFEVETGPTRIARDLPRGKVFSLLGRDGVPSSAHCEGTSLKSGEI